VKEIWLIMKLSLDTMPEKVSQPSILRCPKGFLSQVFYVHHKLFWQEDHTS